MREYVEKALHTRVDCEPVDASGLPLYLRGLYSLERWTAFGVPFAVASPVESPTVKTMAKHRDALEAALGTPVSFALEGATGYRVGRMLEAGLPFIADYLRHTAATGYLPSSYCALLSSPAGCEG